MLPDVLVHARAGEVAKRVGVTVAVAEEATAALDRQELAHRLGEVFVDERRAHEGAVLGAEAERDPAPAHAHVALPQRGDPERPEPLRVALVADAEPPEVDQPHRNGSGPFEGERLLVHVLGHGRAQVRQSFREPDQLVELGLLLARPVIGVVQVLHAPGAVDSGRLQLRVGPRRDPDVAPGRRDPERLDSLQHLRVRDRLPARVHVPEPAARPKPPPPPSSSHRVPVLPRNGGPNPGG